MSVDAKEVFGPAAASHLPIIAAVLNDIGEHRYEFMEVDRFVETSTRDLGDGQRIYWTEMLYRAHFAASTSLIRTQRWIDAIFTSVRDANFTAFSAAYRGCLEAAADSFHTFRSVPPQIADFHTVIRAALAKTPADPGIFPDLENALIHFTHAGYVKKGEDVNPAHRAKATTEYLNGLATITPEVLDCYREVCDVTHPGLGSVKCYADTFPTENGTGYRLRTDLDAILIRQFCEKYEPVSRTMIFNSVVPPVITLRILNEFGVPEVHTPGASRVLRAGHPFWIGFDSRLADDSPPAGKILEYPEA